MFCRRWLSVAISLGTFLRILQATAFAQPEAVTADQVIAKYLEAIGANRFRSISSLIETGDLSGNVTNFSQSAYSPSQFQHAKERGTFEFYFKAPNLRFGLELTDNKVAIEAHGCDGIVSWHIDAQARRSELKPKPENEGECENGYDPTPLRMRAKNVRIRLDGKKQIGDRAAWEIKVDDPKSRSPETYYFDAETYFLLREGRLGSDGSITYSDYRDVGGIRVPFTIIHRLANFERVTTVREMKLNASIDDARFTEPKGDIWAGPGGPPPGGRDIETEIYNSSAPDAPAVNSIMEVNTPRFTSCSSTELQRIVPELQGLKIAPDQQKLAALLDKIGAKTVDLAWKTPNLISQEAVVESRQGVIETRQKFSYLILPHPQGTTAVTLDEFRVDLKSGEKFQSDEAQKSVVSGSSDSSPWADLARASQQLAALQPGRGPQSQGFANMWIYFYPLNQSESTFRYLGEQKMDGRHTLVLAFEQDPKSVRSPAEFRFEGKTTPIFFQGVAWVDASDFRIVRLRTDLLSPIPEVNLRRLTAEIRFVEKRIAEVATPLSLPSEVIVTSEVRGVTLLDDHKYSNYRLFRAHSKIVLNP